MKITASYSLALVVLAFAPWAAFAVDALPLKNASPLDNDAMPEFNPPADTPPQKSGSAPAPGKKGRLSAQSVEVRLKDGSSLRGELKSSEPIALKTTFGVLKFPMEQLLQVSHGESSTALNEKEFAALLADFKGADADKRAAADQRLLDAGKSSLDPLFSLRANAAADLKPRIDDLLKRIYVQSSDTPEIYDTVRAAQFEAKGTLELQTLMMSSKLGDLTLKLTDVSSIRWIAHGDTQLMELNALVAVREWIDTGVDAVLGEQMSINCSGSATIFNTQIVPNGVGNQDNQPFQFGAVIGKLGPDGEPFLIGDEKSWKPDSNQRLFVRIYVSDEVLQNNGNTNRDRGSFNVRIACGTRIKEAAGQPNFVAPQPPGN